MYYSIVKILQIFAEIASVDLFKKLFSIISLFFSLLIDVLRSNMNLLFNYNKQLLTIVCWL